MNIKSKLKLNNRGAGIITVMIGILFLTAFGSLLLILSYSGFEMRISDRQSKQNLYDASAIMEEINAGVQEACSEAIVSTYADTLVYFNDSISTVTAEFRQNYHNNIVGWVVKKTVEEEGTGERVYDSEQKKYVTETVTTSKRVNYTDENGNTIPLFTQVGKWRYNLDALRFMVVDGKDVNYVIVKEDTYNSEGEITNTVYRIYDYSDESNIKLTTDITYDEIENGDYDYAVISSTGDRTVENIKVDTTDTDYFADSDNLKPIILKGVAVYYKKDGRATRVVSDITIDYPGVGYKTNGYSTSGISQYACIVKGNLIHEGGEVASTSKAAAINGNAYFGNVKISSIGKLNLTNGTFICPGIINVNGTGVNETDRLTTSDSAELWTDSIDVHIGSSVDLKGKTYVSNDLVLSGTGSSATIEGEYYGFGDSTENPSESSSIIVNGKETTLDMSKAKFVSIAGFAFIDLNDSTNSNTEDKGIQMGESISVKENQRIYLTPIDLVKATSNGKITGQAAEGQEVAITSNPMKMSAAEFKNTDFELVDSELWGGKKCSDYGISLHAINDNSNEESLTYIFMSFDTNDDANEFFKDYFAAYPEEINGYIEERVSYTLPSSSAINTAGGYINNNGKAVMGTASANSSSENYKESYENLKLNLAQAPKDETDNYEEPLEYIINQKSLYKTDVNGNIKKDENGNPIYNIEEGDYVEFKNSQGQVVAVVANCDYEVKANDKTTENLNLIIQIGTNHTITVNRDFWGLIMTEGNLKIGNGVTINKSSDSVVKAYEAEKTTTDTDQSSGKITDYFNDEAIEGDDKTSDAWDVSSLVGYENWKRTTE